MRGKPTNEFLAGALRSTAKFLKGERRPVAAKWCNIAAERLEVLNSQVAAATAYNSFVEEMEREKSRKAIS